MVASVPERSVELKKEKDSGGIAGRHHLEDSLSSIGILFIMPHCVMSY